MKLKDMENDTVLHELEHLEGEESAVLGWNYNSACSKIKMWIYAM